MDQHQVGCTYIGICAHKYLDTKLTIQVHTYVYCKSHIYIYIIVFSYSYQAGLDYMKMAGPARSA